MSYKKNNQSKPNSILGKVKDIYQNTAKIAKDPAKALIKAKSNLNKTGKDFINQSQDASKSNLDKTKLYTYGKLTQGVGETVGYGAKGLQAGINLGSKAVNAGVNKIKNSYNDSLSMKPVVSDNLYYLGKAKGKVMSGARTIKNNPGISTIVGGTGAAYVGSKLLKDDESNQNSIIGENTMILTSQLKRRRELLESSYSEPKEGTFYDKVFNSKKEVPDMPDNSGIANLSSKTSDLRYKSEKDQDKEVEEIPTQGGEAPTEESFGKTKIEPITERSDLQVALKIILETVHEGNVELEKNNGISEKNRNKLADVLVDFRERRSKLRRGAESAKDPNVKDFKNRMANTLDNSARIISNKGNMETLKTDSKTALNSKALSTFGNAPRMVKN